MNDESCPVCGGTAALLDVVDFNKSCEEQRRKFLPLSGKAVYYVHCGQCGFAFCPEICGWEPSRFEQDIYNAEYVQVDPDYLGARPRSNARTLVSLLGEHGKSIRHLDYGGGEGLLSRVLTEAGWNSLSYDPMHDHAGALSGLGHFDLVTAFEVFEHVPDVNLLSRDLASLVKEKGIVLFSTLLTDGHIQRNQRLAWWYASPRNGHISLYSRKSLSILGEKAGFHFASFSPAFHVFLKGIPSWARHFIRLK